MTRSNSSNNKVAKMGSFLAMAGVAGLALLGSTIAPAADAAITFGAAVDSPGAIILGGLSSMVPKPPNMMDKYLVPGLMNFTQAGLFITAPTQVVVSVNSSLQNPLGPMNIALGSIGVKILLDGMSLANITTTNITLSAGIGPLAANATIDIADGNTVPALKTSINNVVTSLFGGVTPSGAPPVISIQDITASGNPLGMAPIQIPVQFAPAGPIQPTNVTANAGTPPVFGFGGLMNPLINFTMPTLNKVIVKTQTGAVLTAGVGFSWNNPLNVALDIPYLQVDLGLNGTRIVTVGIQDLHLAPGEMTAETLVNLEFNNDAEASAQLGALVGDFLGGTLNQVVNIGNFSFGTPSNMSATGYLLNSLFSELDINLPLLNVSTVAIEQLILGYITPYLPIDISKLGEGTGPSLMTYIQGLTVSTAPGHTLLISPKITLPLPFELDLNIPYFALDINLNGNQLGQLFLADLVGTGSGNVDISVGVGIVFTEPSPQIPPTVAQLVSALTSSGGSLDITAGVSNLALGMSPSDAINTLNGVDVALPISDVITGHIDLAQLLQTVMAETSVSIAPTAVAIKVGSLAQLTIHEASIAVLPNNMITAGVNLDMFLGLPIVANIGYLGLQLSLDGANLAGVSLTSGLNYGGGTVQMDAGIAISVGTGPAIAGKVAALVNAIIAHQPVSSSVGVSGIVIGQSSSDLIEALSQVSISLPLGGLLGGNAPSLPGGFLNSTLAQLGLSVADISLATVPNAGLSIGATAKFNNPIPISLSVPYIGISGGLDNVDILNVGVDNLAMSPGANTLQAEVDLYFSNAVAAQTKVATLLGELLGGQLGNTPEALTVHNLRIGASPSDYFDLLSQIDISIPSKDVLNKANLDLLTSKLGMNLTQMAGNLLNSVEIGAISANLNNAPVMELGATVSVNNFSLPVAVNIGYFGIDLALDSDALAHVDVPSITIATANNKLTLTVKASVTVQDTPAIQTDIAKLVGYFMSNTTTSPVQNLVLSKPLIGVSTTDNIQTFSLISYPVALPALLTKAKAYINQLLAGAGGLNMNNIALSNLVVDLNSPSIINIQGGLLIKNLTLPADISINYVGVSLGLDSVPLADLTLPTLALSSANNELSINFQALVNVQQGPQLSGQIANLVGSLLYPGQVKPPTDLVIYDPVFGGDPNHLFHILSQIKVDIALAPYLQKIGAMINGALSGGAGGNLLAGLDIGSMVVDLNSPQTIGIDAAIAIKNVTIPAEIKLNYVGVNLAINTVGLAQVSIPSFSLKPANGALAITAHVDVALMTSDALTSAITNLVGAVINNQTTPETNLVISGAVFGGSPTNVFTILQAIAIPINVAPYINKIPALLAGESSLLNRVAVSQLVVDLNAPQVVGIDAAVTIKNITLPAQIKLNYVGANVAIGQVPLVQLGIPSFSMTPSNGDLNIALHINLAIQESAALSQTVNGLVQAIVGGKALPSTQLVISGAAFGGSSTDVFTFLQGVKIPLDVTAYLNKIPALLAGSGSILNGISISNLAVDLNAPQVVGIDASVLVRNVSLPAQIKLNYVGANAAISGIPLASVAIPTFTMAPQGNDLALTVHVDLTLMASDNLSKAISGLIGAVLSNQTLPETDLQISGAVFGASSTNFFTILQDVVIPINVTPYIAKIGGMLSGAGSLLNGIGLSGLAINLNQAPVIGIDANVDIKNLALPAKLSVGYLGLDIAINSVPLVQVSIPKLVLGQNGADLTIGTHVDITLLETDASETLVAGLVNAVVAGQAPQGTIMISGIGFGPSQSNVFKILQGVQIPIPISKILSLVPSTGATNTSSLLNAISLESADINMKNPPSIGADIDVALLGYSFNAQLLLNYVSISAFLDTTPLATISVPGITLSSGNNQIDLKVNSLVNLASGSDIQAKVAAIASQVMGNGGSDSVNLVVSNIAFGGSAGSVFHILDKVQVSVALAPYIQKLTGIVGGITGGNSTTAAPAFSISQLDVSAPGANDLSIALAASIGGIGSKISVEMPYVGLQISAGGASFIAPTINNFQLQNGNIALTLDLPFQPAAKQIIASLSTPVSQLMFSTVGTVPGSIVVNSIIFGASASQAFDIASKIGLEIQLNSVFQKAQAYINAHNPLHVTDMNTVLTTTGIQATIAVPGIPLTVPLNMKFGISLSAAYQGMPFVAIQATGMSLAQSPWSLGANINVIEPAFGTAMNGILPNALTWKNAMQDVTIGGVTLGAFTALQGLTITPPSITLWSPINIPLNELQLHLSPLGMDFAAQFVNHGPLQVDMGTVDILIMEQTTTVVEVTSLGGPIHLNNVNQSGGNNQISLNASLKFSILQVLSIINALLFHPGDFKFVFNMRTSAGQPMPWLENALNGVPQTVFQNLLPILVSALKNLSFSI
ncbi:hypothetical protein EMPS_02469 [Entomortierella parvispora]|uniref:Uncharacterized protein n=1 Tax=Entomortierella parvispora TaxID=205924 RepID=A0A9P3LTZ0_9FUNG|nr:hypothetical protein EMPS_02469 [Entomortierella parvispora]